MKTPSWLSRLVNAVAGEPNDNYEPFHVACERYYAPIRRRNELEQKAKRLMKSLRSDGHDNGAQHWGSNETG